MTPNPYHPPRDGQEDSRAAAVRESQRLVEANGGRIPDDRSFCLPVANADPRVLREYVVWVFWRFLLGLIGSALGLVCLIPEILSGGQQLRLLASGLCLFLSGLLLIFSNLFLLRRFVRRRLGRRYMELIEVSEEYKPSCVTVRDTDSISSLKMGSEDWGYIRITPSIHSAMIEGILFRYLIHARDVLHMEKAVVAEQSAVILSSSIGKEILRITLVQNAHLAGTALFKQLQEALTSVSPPPDDASGKNGEYFTES